MQLEKKKISFVYSRLRLNDAPLLYMPFGLSTVKMLDSMGCEVDLFLSEKSSSAYLNVFSERVKVHFLDNNLLWNQGFGQRHFFLFTNYFKHFIIKQRKKYDVVFGMGIAGNTLARYLAQKSKSFFVAMNDEFPDIYYAEIWKNQEKKSISHADMVVVPDESRFEELCNEIPAIKKKNWATLPNAPLLRDMKDIPKIDWSKSLNIPENTFPFLFTGDTGPIYMLYDIMLTCPNWPENTVLIVCCSEEAVRKVMNHLVLPGKVIFIEKKLPNPEFHSLVQFCTASFGMYRTDLFKLNFIGKSSGKIMRSIACSRPVIAPNVPSLEFIVKNNLGLLVNHPSEIPDAVSKIISNHTFNASCNKEFSTTLHFEKYWERFVETITKMA